MMARDPKKSVVVPNCPNIVLKYLEPLVRIGTVIGLFPMLNIRNLKTQKLTENRLNLLRVIFHVIFFVLTVIDVFVSYAVGDTFQVKDFHDFSVFCLVFFHRVCGIAIWIQFVTKSGILLTFFRCWSKYPMLDKSSEPMLKCSFRIIIRFLFLIIAFGGFQIVSFFFDTKHTSAISESGPYFIGIAIRVMITSTYFSYQIFLFSLTFYFLAALIWCLKKQAQELKTLLSTNSNHEIKEIRQRYLFLYKMLQKFEMFLSPGLTMTIVHSSLDMCLNVTTATMTIIMSEKSWFFIFSPGVFFILRFLPLTILFWMADQMQSEVRLCVIQCDRQ